MKSKSILGIIIIIISLLSCSDNFISNNLSETQSDDEDYPYIFKE